MKMNCEECGKESGFYKYCKECYSKKKDKLKEIHYVYIIECDDGSYYTGYSSNLLDRITDHKLGNGSDYSKKHGFKCLLYFERQLNKKEALKREKEIKSKGRIYRQMLIREFQKILIYMK